MVPSDSEIEVTIEGGDWQRLGDPEALVIRAVRAALAGAPSRVGAIGVLLTDDAAIRALNAGFRGKDKATNVLSFPAPAMPGDPEPMLGDIALGFETCAREADDESKTLQDHATHLVIHGVLHLLGLNHETETEAEAMETREIAVLAGLGIADPYAETVPLPATGGAAQ
jgi:probable rRNA maturation factor